MTSGRGAVAAALVLGAACAGSPEPPRPEPVASEPPPVRVAPGDPDALAAALASRAPRVELLPGVHRPRGPIRLVRAVILAGAGDGGGARLYAPVAVSGPDVRIEDLQLRAGLDVRYAPGLSVESATVSGSGRRDAVTLVESEARFRRVYVEAGRESGVFASSSTVSWHEGWVRGGVRSVRIDAGRAQLVGVDLEGPQLGALWADRGAQVELTDVDVLAPAASATALHATEGATVEGVDLELQAGGAAVIARTARVELSTVTVDHSGLSAALGVAGATVTVRRSRLRAGPGGLAAVGPYRRFGSRLSLDDVSVIMPRGGTAVTVARGSVTARNVTLRGGGAAALGPADAEAGFVVRGPRAAVDLDGVRIERWPGLGGIFTRDASVRVRSSTVTSASGGFFVDGIRHPPARLSRVRVEGCVSEPGLAFAATTARVSTATITRCPPGGVFAGSRADVELDDVHVRRARFGFGAFDGARMEVRGGSVSTATVGALAGCLGGARVELLGTRTASTARESLSCLGR
jgi:hypothetical protein